VLVAGCLQCFETVSQATRQQEGHHARKNPAPQNVKFSLFGNWEIWTNLAKLPGN